MKKGFIVVALLLVLGVARSSSATTYYFGATGGGACTDVVSCEIAMMSQVWGVTIPPDTAPPTVINLKTGTYTGCPGAGCATGIAQGPYNNTTISQSSFTVTNASLSLSSANNGWNYAIMQNNGGITCSGGAGSGFPINNGCWMKGTISGASGTSFTASTPTSSSGTCTGAFGSGLVTDTTATVVVWDGKDYTGLNNAETAATNAATAYNTGAVLYIPAGKYVIDTNNRPSLNYVTVQCQSPATTELIHPFVDTNNTYLFDIFQNNNNNHIKNCTLEGMNTNAHSASTSRQHDNAIRNYGLNNVIEGNTIRWIWGDQAIELAASSPSGSTPPCPLGQAPYNSNTQCIYASTNLLIQNNIFQNNEGFAVEFFAGQDVRVDGNKLLDTDLNMETGDASLSTAALQGIFSNNDLHCDATGGGKYHDNLTAGCGAAGFSGCLLNTTNNGTASWANSYQVANHMHADNAAPAAACWDTTTTVKPTKRGNKCTAGENCSNRGGC